MTSEKDILKVYVSHTILELKAAHFLLCLTPMSRKLEITHNTIRQT